MMINDVEYIRKDDISQKSEKIEGLEYVIIRTYSAGVHAGYLKSQSGKEVVLINSRRLWKWSGANELCQMAMEGVSNPDGCKFSVPTIKLKLTEAIEILDTTEKARKSITGVKEWKK